MKLKISNFAKIEEADIKIDGITVICGDNDTGKSTIGKILFSIFNFDNYKNERIKKDFRIKVSRILNKYISINKREYYYFELMDSLYYDIDYPYNEINRDKLYNKLKKNIHDRIINNINFSQESTFGKVLAIKQSTAVVNDPENICLSISG